MQEGKTYMEPNDQRAKVMTRVSIAVSIAVLALVGVMRRVKLDLGIDFSFLPPYHAVFNTVVAISLIAALYFVKKGNIKGHQRSINLAMLFSGLFLLCYVLYHFTTEETKYCGEGTMRTVYFILLISHIVLAGISLPFILLTYTKGFNYQIASHRKMAKWVYPIWLYVAVTGPICYLMLKPCYS